LAKSAVQDNSILLYSGNQHRSNQMDSHQIKHDEGVSNIDHAFDHPERIKLLEMIDQFRELGLSEEVSLPQV